MQRKSLNELADLLVNALLERGFIIQRYDAYSTSSIYLKLDYGVCNSIRISDHLGKKHLNYRYNIGPMYKRMNRTNRPYTRYYYPVGSVGELIRLIANERSLKFDKYGAKKYAEYMQQNKEQGKYQPGFWQQARLIEGREKACF